MATTFTAKLALTDSGNTFSSSTSTPLTITFDYTETFNQTVNVANLASATIDVSGTMASPQFFMARMLSGNGTMVVSNAGTGASVTSLNSEGGWALFSNISTGGQRIDKVVFTAAATSQLQVIAYGK